MFLSDSNKIVTAYAYVLLLLIHKTQYFTSIISFNPLSNPVKQCYYHHPHFTEKKTEPKRG